MSLSWTGAATWLLHCALGGGLVLLVTWALMRGTRQPARRQRLGEWGMAAALAVAGLSLVGPAWLVLPWPAPAAPCAPVAPAASLPPAVEDLADLVWQWDHVPEVADEPLAIAAPPPLLEAEEPPPWWEAALPALVPAVVAAYGLFVVALLARWLLGYVGLRRLLRGASPAPADVARLFGEMASPPPPRLLTSGRLRVPISFGLLRPTVVLPAAMCTPPAPARLRWVFAHELTHLERRDAWSALLFALGQAIFFYLPWLWSIKRQVRLCQEYVADAAAADRRESAADYAEFLLGLSGAPAVPAAACGVSGTTTDLFRRVTMLLQEPIRVEKRCPRRWTLAAAGGLFSLAFLVAGVGLRADAQQVIVIRDGKADAVQAKDGEGKKIKVLVEPGAGGKDEKVIILREAGGEPAGVQKIVLQGQGEGILPKIINVDVDVVLKALQELPGDLGFDREAMRQQIEMAIKQIKVIPGQGKIEVEVDKFLPGGGRFGGGFGGGGQGLDGDALAKFLKAMEGNPTPEQIAKAAKAFAEAMKKGRPGGMMGMGFGGLGGMGGGKGGMGGGMGWGPRTALTGAARLGVQVEKPAAALADQLDLPRDRGLLVTRVQDNTPASRAGLKTNDVLVEVGGKAVPNDPAKFATLLDGVKGKADVVVLRKGKRETIRGVELSEQGTGGPRRWDQLLLPGGAQGQFFGPPGAVMTTTFRTDDRFTTRHQEGSLIITVTGTVEGGKAKLGQAVIQDGNVSNTYDSLDRVPAQHRDKVTYLLQVSGGPAPVEKGR